MWDDWGGWFDPVKPVFEDYDGLGFRVPLLIVSPYARQGYVTHKQYETSSVLRFIEDTFGLPQMAASDKRAHDPAGDAFNFNQQPRAIQEDWRQQAAALLEAARSFCTPSQQADRDDGRRLAVVRRRNRQSATKDVTHRFPRFAMEKGAFVNRVLSMAAPLVAVLALAACNAGGSSNMPGTPGQSNAATRSMPEWQAKGLAHAACPQIVGKPSCLALTTNRVSPLCTGATCGWAPIDLQTRYNLPSNTKGAGQIVAIVDLLRQPQRGQRPRRLPVAVRLRSGELHQV